MMNKHFKSFALLFLFATSFNWCLSQTFEGFVSYKITALNPMPTEIDDSTWNATIREQFGEEGSMSQKYFYKGKNYTSFIKAGTEKGRQTYNPNDKFLYTWQEGTEEAIKMNTQNSSLDAFNKIEKLSETKTILGF